VDDNLPRGPWRAVIGPGQVDAPEIQAPAGEPVRDDRGLMTRDDATGLNSEYRAGLKQMVLGGPVIRCVQVPVAANRRSAAVKAPRLSRIHRPVRTRARICASVYPQASASLRLKTPPCISVSMVSFCGLPGGDVRLWTATDAMWARMTCCSAPSGPTSRHRARNAPGPGEAGHQVSYWRADLPVGILGIMQFGRSYEEFEVGAVYKHWPGKTVTEYDDHLFCLLTMNHHPLHLDANYAGQTTQFKQNVVVGNYIYSLLLGMSVPDVSGKAIANLEIESLRHVAPTFHGDTIYGETTVLDKWESKSKDDRGVVYVETKGYKQDGTLVCVFKRKVMVPKQNYLDARGGEQPGRPILREDS
jgi:acyl dehydratase